MAFIVLLVVVGSAIWVAFDASHLGVKPHCLGGGLADMGPVGWFFCVLLLWIIGFPVYLATRPKYAMRKGSGQAGSLGHVATAGNAQTSTPPAGWYADPNLQGGQRWWDGNQWGPPSAPPPIPTASKR
jgi:hypothetical protein